MTTKAFWIHCAAEILYAPEMVVGKTLSLQQLNQLIVPRVEAKGLSVPKPRVAFSWAIKMLKQTLKAIEPDGKGYHKLTQAGEDYRAKHSKDDLIKFLFDNHTERRKLWQEKQKLIAPKITGQKISVSVKGVTLEGNAKDIARIISELGAAVV